MILPFQDHQSIQCTYQDRSTHPRRAFHPQDSRLHFHHPPGRIGQWGSIHCRYTGQEDSTQNPHQETRRRSHRENSTIHQPLLHPQDSKYLFRSIAQEDNMRYQNMTPHPQHSNPLWNTRVLVGSILPRNSFRSIRSIPPRSILVKASSISHRSILLKVRSRLHSFHPCSTYLVENRSRSNLRNILSEKGSNSPRNILLKKVRNDGPRSIHRKNRSKNPPIPFCSTFYQGHNTHRRTHKLKKEVGRGYYSVWYRVRLPSLRIVHMKTDTITERKNPRSQGITLRIG